MHNHTDIFKVGDTIYNREILTLVLGRFYKNVRMNTAVKWDTHRGKTKKVIYPASYEIMAYYGVSTWEEIKDLSEKTFFDYKKKHKLVDYVSITKILQNEIAQKQTLLTIEPYKEQLTDKSTDYPIIAQQIEKEHGVSLPSVTNIVNRFGSWSEFRDRMGLNGVPIEDILRKERDRYLPILIKQGSELTSANWNKMNKEIGLPSLQHSLKIFTPEDLSQYTRYRKHYTSEQLKELVWKHRNEFTLSVRKWQIYAYNNNLPVRSTFIKLWGLETVNAIINYFKTAGDHATFEKLNKIIESGIKG